MHAGREFLARCAAEVGAVRARLQTETALRVLRSLTDAQLRALPAPLGFHPLRLHMTNRNRARQHKMGPDPPPASAQPPVRVYLFELILCRQSISFERGGFPSPTMECTMTRTTASPFRTVTSLCPRGRALGSHRTRSTRDACRVLRLTPVPAMAVVAVGVAPLSGGEGAPIRFIPGAFSCRRRGCRTS